MITKVGMIILLEHDVDAAVEFYKKLGLKQIFHIKESWAEFAVADVKLGLCPTQQKPHDRVTGVVLEVDDIKAFYEQHKDDIHFRSEPIEKVHGLMASIQDPGGNIIDLYQPTPERVQDLVKQVVEKDAESGHTDSSESHEKVSAHEDKHGCNPDDCRCKLDTSDA